MSTPIRFESVSKKYRLGLGHTSLREAITLPIRRLRGTDDGRNSRNSILWALKDVSFQVTRGQALGLVGPNGAGKTTILKVLAKITQPTSGEVEVNGRVAPLIELGSGFHPDLTGRENIHLNSAILGMSRAETNYVFDQIVEFSGLETFIDTPVKRYSSGMYVRLGFSIAVHAHPEILLVDEVLAVGDASFRQRCADKIEQLRLAATTIIFVSHNPHLVASVCDRALFLADGRIAARGDSVSVIKTYEDWQRKSRILSVASNHESSVVRADPSEASPFGIDSVELSKPGGEPGDGLAYDEPAQVKVKWRAHEPIDNARLVIRISRADGVTCCMIRSDIQGFAIGSLHGNGAIAFRIEPLQLTSGAYMVDARLLGKLDGIVLARGQSGLIEVDGPYVASGNSNGVFVPKVHSFAVEHETVQPAIFPLA